MPFPEQFIDCPFHILIYIQFRISKGVLHLSCGPLGIAALTDSTNPEILELE